LIFEAQVSIRLGQARVDHDDVRPQVVNRSARHVLPGRRTKDGPYEKQQDATVIVGQVVTWAQNRSLVHASW
jgi:hypothetical protein